MVFNTFGFQKEVNQEIILGGVREREDNRYTFVENTVLSYYPKNIDTLVKPMNRD